MVTHWAVNDQVAAFLVADTLRRMREDAEHRGRRRAARRAARHAGGRRQGTAGGNRPSVLLGAVRGDRRGRRARRRERPSSTFHPGTSPVYKRRRQAHGGPRNGDHRVPRQVRDQAYAWPRRDGHRVRGLGPDHRAPGGDQDRRCRKCRRSGNRGGARPVPPRGAGGRPADASQHRRRVRLRRDQRPRLHRHGIRRRPAAEDRCSTSRSGSRWRTSSASWRTCSPACSSATSAASCTATSSRPTSC